MLHENSKIYYCLMEENVVAKTLPAVDAIS